MRWVDRFRDNIDGLCDRCGVVLRMCLKWGDVGWAEGRVVWVRAATITRAGACAASQPAPVPRIQIQNEALPLEGYAPCRCPPARGMANTEPSSTRTGIPSLNRCAFLVPPRRAVRSEKWRVASRSALRHDTNAMIYSIVYIRPLFVPPAYLGH